MQTSKDKKGKCSHKKGERGQETRYTQRNGVESTHQNCQNHWAELARVAMTHVVDRGYVRKPMVLPS